MTKLDFISAYAEKTGYPKTVAKEAVEAFLQTITEGLEKDKEVVFTGFGKFTTKFTEARQTNSFGRVVDVAAKTKVVFKAGKSLTDTFNS